MSNVRGGRVHYRCSFCNKGQEEVRRLIAGPSQVYICDECVQLCREIIEEEEPQAPRATPALTRILTHIRIRIRIIMVTTLSGFITMVTVIIITRLGDSTPSIPTHMIREAWRSSRAMHTPQPRTPTYHTHHSSRS